MSTIQEIVKPELDFRQKTTTVPVYKFRQYVPENGTTVQLQNTTSVSHVFRFGAGFVLNLNKTRLQYTIRITPEQYFMTLLWPEIQLAAVRLETDNGTVIMDQQLMHIAQKVTRMANIRRGAPSLEPMWRSSGVTHAVFNTTGTAAAVDLPQDLYQWSACALNTLVYSNFATTVMNRQPVAINRGIQCDPIFDGQQFKPYAITERSTGANYAVVTAMLFRGGAVYAKHMRYYSGATDKAVLGCEDDTATVANIKTDNAINLYRAHDSYLPLIPIDGYVNQTAYDLRFDQRLGDVIPHSVFTAMQDMWFGGHSLVLTLTWRPATQWGFKCVHGAAGANLLCGEGIAAIANDKIAFSTGVSGWPGYPVLMVACQDSPSVVSAIQQQVLGPGLTIPVQHMEVVRMSTGATAAGHKYYQTFKLSLAQGSALLRVYHAFARADDACNMDEIGQPFAPNGTSSFTNARLFVNAQPLQDGLETPYEWYQKNRAIYDNCQLYGYESNFTYYGQPWIVDWTGFPDMISDTPSSGLTLQAPTDYQLEATITGTNSEAQNCFSVFVFLRWLRLSAAGVSFTPV